MKKRRKPKRKRGGATYECPSCGWRSEVLETRRLWRKIHRKRRCLGCGNVFETEEGEVGQ